LITASAPGKCILLGEHAVVYGYPAIAIALNMRSYCVLEPITESSIQFHIPDYEIHLEFKTVHEMQSDIPTHYRQFANVMDLLTKNYDFQINKISIRIHSELWKGAGLGSSASTAVAFLYAINEMYELNLSDNQINEFALFMEQTVHGTPSGIDNSICLMGGALVFQKEIREKLIIPKFPVLITYSGESHDTAKIIQIIRNKQDQLRKKFKKIGEIVEEGIIALKQKDYTHLGNLFNKNHEILSKMGLSTHNIEDIISLSRKNDAYGAKLTGAGVGGSVLTLGELPKLQKIQYLLKKMGYRSTLSCLDYNGGRIDSK
jgi:mevalonate kinase